MKGAKKRGVRIGNWLTAEQSKNLLAAFESKTLRSKRDYAIVAVLLDAGCAARSLLPCPSWIYSSAKSIGC